MKLKVLRNKKWFAWLSNIYVIIITAFVIWMLFFDANSMRTQRELEKDINDLKKQRQYLQKAIDKDKALIKKLRHDETLEKFAREEYFLKKDDEEIYIIEYEDSLKR